MRPLIFAVAAAVAAPLTAARPAEWVVREVYLMGTIARFSAVDDDRRSGLARLDRMVRAIEATEAEISTWRDSSEVSGINAQAGTGPRKVSAQLCGTLERLARWTLDTGGAFDPAVGALSSAWDLHGEGRIPDPAELARARERSRWARVRFDRARCTIELPSGFALEVGGWGKGAGLDRARSAGPDVPWLIDFGGQVAAQGAPPGANGWPVAIAHPQRRQVPALEVRLSGGSLATSGGSERDLAVGGARVGHIIDPATGRPAPFTGSVTVWHEEALAADILSTALFVMGPERGAAWAEARGIAALYLLPADGGVVKKPTAAFTRRFGSISAARPAGR